MVIGPRGQSGPGTKLTSSPSAEVKNEWSCTSLVLYDVMAWVGAALCFIVFFTVALLTCSVCQKPRITLMTVRFFVDIGLLPLELT